MSETNFPRLLAAAKEFNIGQETLIDFLVKKGYNRASLKPSVKLNEQQYYAIQKEYQSDKVAKSKADRVIVPERVVISARKKYKPKPTSADVFLANAKTLIIQTAHKQIITERRPATAVIKQSSAFNEEAFMLIGKNLDTKNPVLDLGKLNLSDRDLMRGLPMDDMLKKCTHLKQLILSNKWKEGPNNYKTSSNKGKNNFLTKIPDCIAFLENLTHLYCGGDLDNPWKISDWRDITGLPNLEYVDLSENQINELIFDENFPETITHFNLSGNNLSSVRVLSQGLELTNVDLSHNSIRTVEGFEKLKKLHTLDLSFNHLDQLTFLEEFEVLTTLFVSHNEIAEISGIEKLTNLCALDLSFNNLTKLDGFEKINNLFSLLLDGNTLQNFDVLQEFPNLIGLGLRGTGLRNVSIIQKLVNLEDLSLDDNEITTISDNLVGLKSLKTITISNNKLEEVNGFAELTALEKINLKFNRVKDVRPLFTLPKLQDVLLDGNPALEDIPEEVKKVGWIAIKDRLIRGNLTVFNEVKILLLGNTNVGKSNLLEYLTTNKQPTGEDSTHGISYQRLVKTIPGVTLHIWDFGGQEFFHATHQLFFSPGGLNIILWSKKDIQRDIQNPEACFDLAYWIRCVERLVPNDSDNKIEVIIVENKIDLNDFTLTPLDQVGFLDKYANLNFNFTGICLRPLKRIANFGELLEERVMKLTTRHPKDYLKYYGEINQSSTGLFKISSLANEDPAAVATAMKVFHNMGVLLYFPSILPDKVFVKPQELLDLLYKKILDAKKQVEISKKDIKNSIKENKLGLDIEEVVALLKKFDLVFQIPNKPSLFFVPQYLPEAPTFIKFFHNHQFKKANIIIGSDNYLMNIAMLKVFGEYGKYVQGEKERLFWKDGIIIAKDSMLLMITFDRENQKILLFNDASNNNFELQKEIVSFILNIPVNEIATSKTPQDIINTEINRVDWSSNYFTVYVSLDGKYFANWQVLFEQRKKGIFQLEVSTMLLSHVSPGYDFSSKTVSVFDFNIYLPKDSKGKMKKIFISYSKDNLALINKFQEHLAALKMDGKVATWYCTELRAGSEWNHEIQEHFNEADIICFMISPNFMNTDYIHEHEIKKAFERKEKDEHFIILPIILDFCRWETEHNNLADFTALPYTAMPIMDFRNQNMAWYVVQECIRLIIDEGLQPSGEDLYKNPKLPKTVLKLLERIADGKVNDNSEIT